MVTWYRQMDRRRGERGRKAIRVLPKIVIFSLEGRLLEDGLEGWLDMLRDILN